MKTMLYALGSALALTVAVGCGDDGEEATTTSTTAAPTTTTMGQGGSTTTSTTSSAMGGMAAGGNGAGGGNTAPVASFTATPDCTDNSTTQVTFTSTSTDADGDALTCSWTFNSGTPASGDTCEVTGVTFPSVAPYDVTLVVDDGTSTGSVTIPIAPCN